MGNIRSFGHGRARHPRPAKPITYNPRPIYRVAPEPTAHLPRWKRFWAWLKA